MPGALDGIRVLDLSWGIAGPLGVLMLAEQGADTIKVEPPGGDPFRSYSGYKVWTRSRRSVTVDLKSDAGREAFLELVETADVVVESFRPGVMERLGVGYDACAAASTGGSCTARCPGTRRATGWRAAPGYDALVQASSGQQWEQPGWRLGPIFLAMPMPSMGAIFLVASGVLSALIARETTGRGQHVSTSLLQGAWLYTTQIWQDIEKADASIYAMMAKTNPPGVHQPMIFECADNEFVHISVMSGLHAAEVARRRRRRGAAPRLVGRRAHADGGRERARRPVARGVPETEARRSRRRADREQPRGRGDRHARGAVRAPAAGGERHGGDRRRPRPRPDHADRRARSTSWRRPARSPVRNPRVGEHNDEIWGSLGYTSAARSPPWRTAPPP